MACGAPVVATATGGIPEIVVDGETGYLVPLGGTVVDGPADPALFAATLAAHVNSLLGDRATARRLGEAGRRRVVERFSWTAVASRTADLYAQVCR
jgi:starch synthase